MTTYIGTATYDTTNSSNAPTTNGDSAVTFAVGHYTSDSGTRRALIKFDLSSIPSNATINSGTLSITYAVDHAGVAGTICAYRQLKNWVSSQTTWNIMATGTNWTTAGGFDAADCEQSEVGSATFSATETMNVAKNIPISAIKLQDWLTGGTLSNYGFLLKNTVESNNYYDFHSHEASTANYRPTLTIDYTPFGTGYTLILNT
jgi:hypothetical protein